MFSVSSGFFCKNYFPALFDRCLFKPALAGEQNVAEQGRCHSRLPGRARFEQSDAASNSSCVSAKERWFVFFSFFQKVKHEREVALKKKKSCFRVLIARQR